MEVITWITKVTVRSATVMLVGALGAGCSMSGADVTFEESEAEARESATIVAEAVADADSLERMTVGPLDCGGSNRYADLNAYLPLDSPPDESTLDEIGVAVGERDFREVERQQFSVGPHRRWEADDDVTISVTVLTDEQALRIKTRGRCGAPPT